MHRIKKLWPIDVWRAHSRLIQVRLINNTYLQDYTHYYLMIKSNQT